MEQTPEPAWRPMPDLPRGHYAIGRLTSGGEAHIFNAGGSILDVSTGKSVIVVGWRPLDVHSFREGAKPGPA